MFERVGKKLVQGAKAEIAENPVSILDTDKLIEWTEIALGAGLLILGIFFGGRRGHSSSQQPSTIIINNYIQGGDRDEHSEEY